MTIRINGNHKSVTIINGIITIDGKVITSEEYPELDEKRITLIIEGYVDSAQTTSGDVIINGECNTARTVSGDIKCGDISGSVNTVSGDIACGSVGGSVSTVSGDINNRR